MGHRCEVNTECIAAEVEYNKYQVSVILVLGVLMENSFTALIGAVKINALS